MSISNVNGMKICKEVRSCCIYDNQTLKNVNLLVVLFALDYCADLFSSSSVCLAVLSVLLFVRLKSERYDIFVLK